MRYLVFLRGAPGSGKSTFIRENNLSPYTISSDNVRILLKPPVLSVTGKFMLSQKINPRVWGLIYSVIKCRLESGDFTVLDATNAGNADISKYRKLVKTHRYRAFCIDFTDVPLEVAKERNKQRPEYEIVPEAVIDEMYSIISAQKVPSFVTVIKPNEFRERLQYRIADFSHYRRIHHIGDVNGNYAALRKYFECGLEDSDLYIFTGDYADMTFPEVLRDNFVPDGNYAEGRAENTEVIKFLSSVICKNNVVLLEGDQEKCFFSPIADKDDAQSKIPGFADIRSFLPQGGKKGSIEKEGAVREEGAERKEGTVGEKGIRKSCLFELYRRMEPCICYRFHDKCVLVTHGGLSSLPENLNFVGSAQMINGVGEPEDTSIIAASFNCSTDDNTYQVHGHRNPENLPIKNERTFNLSCEPAQRKVLRVLTLDRTGFHAQEIKNEIQFELQ